MINLRNYVRTAALAILAAGMLAAPMTVAAHASYAVLVPRIQLTDPIPTIDGLITDLEYPTCWKFSRIFYRPRANYAPVLMRMTTTSTHLYVALERVPIGSGLQNRFISLAFDVDHDGGTGPDTDDIRFTVTEANVREASRGNGAGAFTVDPTVTGWTSAVIPNPSDEFALNYEIRIPLSLLGGGERFETIGFHLRHNWLTFQGDDYGWPTTAGWNVPNTWGELIWIVPADRPLEVDVARITQGLETDVTSRVSYDLIAGKKTLVWAQIFANSGTGFINSAEVRVQRVSPGLGPVRTTPASAIPYLLPFSPTGSLSDGRATKFWIPGSHFDQPGRYRFHLAVTRGGNPTPEIVPLGTREYKPTKDFNVLLVPVNLTGVVPDGRDWGDDLTANVARSMQEMERHLPVRDGAEPFSFSVGAPPNAGIRYHLWPMVVEPRDGDTLDTLDPRARQYGNNMLHLANLILELRDRSNTLGRFDRMCILGASTGTGGGQAQNGWSPCTSGAGFDRFLTGASASIVIQELVHCLGWQLVGDSPNNDGGGHSVNWVIPTIGGRNVVNMMTRSLVPDATSAMYYLVNWIPLQFMEGWEWNKTRELLEAKPRLPVCRGCNGEHPAAEGAPPAQVFRLIGEITSEDVVTESFSECRDGEGIDLTPTDPNSPYQLLLLDAGNNVLQSLRFAVNLEATGPHGVLTPEGPGGAAPGGAYSEISDHDMLTEMGFILQMPFAEGAVKAEMRKDDTLLWSKFFTAAAPLISNLQLVDNQQGVIDISWTATDADTVVGDLRHCVFFKQSADAPPLLLAHGIIGPMFTYEAFKLAPASTDARLVVCTTDGKNVTEAESVPFTIPAKPPVAIIIHPDPLNNPGEPPVIQNQPYVFEAAVFDYTDGAIDDSMIEWSSNVDGALGTGRTLPAVSLSTAGPHTITVKATNSANLMASDTALITVLVDQDGDGLPNTYENMHDCLGTLSPDAHEDIDGDGLSALQEMLLGTNPCEADSDEDEHGDGDEVKLGSDPNDDTSKPVADLLFIPGGHIDLGECPAPTQASVPVQTASPGTAWQAAAMADWLIVTGGGTGPGNIQIEAVCGDLPAGEHMGEVLVTVEGGQPRLLEVSLVVPVCRGDVTGDKAITPLDLDAVVNHILEIAPLQGAFIEAADVTQDLRIDVADVIALQNHIDGTTPLPVCE